MMEITELDNAILLTCEDGTSEETKQQWVEEYFGHPDFVMQGMEFPALGIEGHTSAYYREC